MLHITHCSIKKHTSKSNIWNSLALELCMPLTWWSTLALHLLLLHLFLGVRAHVRQNTQSFLLGFLWLISILLGIGLSHQNSNTQSFLFDTLKATRMNTYQWKLIVPNKFMNSGQVPNGLICPQQPAQAGKMNANALEQSVADHHQSLGSHRSWPGPYHHENQNQVWTQKPQSPSPSSQSSPSCHHPKPWTSHWCVSCHQPLEMFP